MSYLLDTQLLLWAVLDPSRMPAAAWALLNDGRPPLYFSVGSIWEAGIKFNRRHRQLAVNPELLRGQLIDGRGPLPGCAGHPAWARASPGPGEPKPARASRGRAASFIGSGPPVGISRPFAPILPAVQTARLPRIEHDYRELAILGEHAVAAAMLPLLHKDPFDRILVAQATLAGITLLTTDARLARYPGPIRLV